MELIALKIKIFTQKLWSFIKAYFKEIGFAIIFIYLIIFVKNKTDIINQLLKDRESSRKAHQENINNLTNQILNEQARRRKIESDFRDLIDTINKNHEEEVKRIATVRAEEIKSLIEQHQNDPVKMSETINNLFGIPVMQTPTEKQTWEPQ